MTSYADNIDSSDQYADSLIDLLYRGGDCSITFTSKAYKAGSIAPFWPWGALGVMATAAAPIGRLASDVAKAFVLTSTANTPAAAAPATLTASLAILAPNSPARLLFNSKLRQVPIKLQCLPSLSSGTVTWFTQT